MSISFTIPLRLIISVINSPTHILAKTIYDELRVCIVTTQSHINNSKDLRAVAGFEN